MRPRSLASQLILLLVLAVVAAQVPVWAIFALKSTKVGRAAFATHVGERVAVLVKVLNAVPTEVVPDIVAAYSIPASRLSVDAEAGVADGTREADDEEIAQLIARRLRVDVDRVRVQLVENVEALVRYVPWRATPKTLLVSVQLAPGRWLNARSRIVQPDAPIWLQIGLVQLAAAVAAILVTLGLGLRHVVRPVTALANAAERFGLGIAVAPLPERGPRELRTMTASYNAMQGRLRAFVADRTRMLGAISHDLRTPLSSLWLRVEMVQEDELREAMVRTLTEMKGMVEATLSFARDDAANESGDLDLAQLAQQLADDHRMLGRDVAFLGPPTAPYHGRSLTLRRALDNLVANAVRYGERARVTLIREPGALRILIDDDGPGLPPDRVDEMFEPFVRLDDSRSTETGGTGLGLAIARSAIREHGGDVTLLNLPVRGLRADVTLPLGEGSPVCYKTESELSLHMQTSASTSSGYNIPINSRGIIGNTLSHMNNDRAGTIAKKGTVELNNSVFYMGSLMSFLIKERNSGAGVSLMEYSSSPGHEPLPHINENHDELLYVLEGELRAYWGKSIIHVATGECIFLPRAQAHAWYVLSSKIRMLIFTQPAGLDEYFGAISSPAESLDLPASSITYAVDDPARAIRIGNEHGIRILTPEEAKILLPHYPDSSSSSDRLSTHS